MLPKQLRILRLVLALCFGGVVTGMALWAGWARAQNSPLMYGQEMTRYTLRDINDAILTYRDQKHTLPRSFSQLKDVKDYADKLLIQEDKINDAWGIPLYTPYAATTIWWFPMGKTGSREARGWIPI